MTDQELEAKLEERQGAKAIVDELTEQIETINPEIKAELQGRGQKRLVIGRWVPQIVEQERKTIDPKKLLSLGVPINVIEMATTVTQVSSLRVNPRGPGDQP